MRAGRTGVIARAAGSGLARPARWLDRAAEHWIGLTLPTPERAVREAGWRRESRSARCARCGGSVGPGEGSSGGCAACRNGTAVADAVVRLGPYRETLRRWILLVKFARWHEMGMHLGAELGTAVKETGLVEAGRTVVVPVPMPWPRRVYRGIDHARVLAEGVARSLEAPVSGLLVRGMGPTQVSQPASRRRRAGGRGLVLRRGGRRNDLEGLQVVLVDDVLTTSATMRAAVRQVRRLRPARVIAAVVAAVEDPSRRSSRVIGGKRGLAGSGISPV